MVCGFAPCAVLDKVRKAYLMAYNGIQWCSFFLIVTALLKCLMKTDGISTAYELTSTMLQFAHALMLLEILHAAFGLVRGGIVPTFLQVRNSCYSPSYFHTLFVLVCLFYIGFWSFCYLVWCCGGH